MIKKDFQITMIIARRKKSSHQANPINQGSDNLQKVKIDE